MKNNDSVKRILIIIDAEGCRKYDPEIPGSDKDAMVYELSGAISVLRASEYDFTILDAHGSGYNIEEKHFPDANGIIHALWNLRSFDYDAAVVLGMHSKSGMDSPVSHTLRREVASLEIDGCIAGELGMLVHWLHRHHIPVAFVSGEDKLKEESEKFGIPYYLYDTSEASVGEMAEHMLDSLSLSNTGEAKTAEVGEIKLSFISPFYTDFFPLSAWEHGRGYISFSSIDNFIDYLPVISQCLSAAETYRTVVMNQIRRVTRDETVRNTYRKRNEKLLSTEVQDITINVLAELVEQCCQLEEIDET